MEMRHTGGCVVTDVCYRLSVPQTMAIESLQTQIKTMAMNHGKEIQKKDSEVNIIV